MTLPLQVRGPANDIRRNNASRWSVGSLRSDYNSSSEDCRRLIRFKWYISHLPLVSRLAPVRCAADGGHGHRLAPAQTQAPSCV